MARDETKREPACLPKALVGVALVLANTACSFFMPTVPGEPSEVRKNAALQCGGYVYPVVDTLSAGVGVVNIAIAASADEHEDTVTYYGAEIGKDAGLALGITQAVLFGAGAVYGYVQASRCTKARERYRLEEARADATGDEQGAAEDAGQPDYGYARSSQAPDPAPQVRRTSAIEFYESLPSWSALRRSPLDDPAGTSEPRPSSTTSTRVGR